MTVRDMILVLFGLDAEKLKQNNWRKCMVFRCVGGVKNANH